MKIPAQRTVKSLGETRVFAQEVAAWLKAQPAGKGSLILLSGPLGTGKTQFTRFLVEALGGRETASPSFALHHRYETSVGAVDHVDLFRVRDEDDLESTGFWELVQAAGVMIIEWSERLEEFGVTDGLPETAGRLCIAMSFGESEAGDERPRIFQVS